MPTCNIMIGLPGVGKSTWIDKHFGNHINVQIASSDWHIEKVAEILGTTYSEIFNDVIKYADRAFFHGLDTYAFNSMDIVVDRTNLTKHSRSKVMNAVKKNAKEPYSFRAFNFITPDPTEHMNRLAKRHGKYITPDTIKAMTMAYQVPSANEGFDMIYNVNPDGNTVEVYKNA